MESSSFPTTLKTWLNATVLNVTCENNIIENFKGTFLLQNLNAIHTNVT